MSVIAIIICLIFDYVCIWALIEAYTDQGFCFVCVCGQRGMGPDLCAEGAIKKVKQHPC